MQTARVGAWSVAIPDGWIQQPSEISGAYIEAPDGAKGIYIYDLAGTPNETTRSVFADYVVDTSIASFLDVNQPSFELVDRRTESFALYSTATADLLDRNANYFIRVVAACGSDDGLRIAIHDYWVESYQHALDFFERIEASISRDEGDQ